MIRLFISDFDGTLLNTTHTISEETNEAITALRKSKISFMPASGRDHMMIMNEMDKINLHPKCIALNGGEFYDNDGKLKISNPIGKKQLLKITNMVQGYDVDVIYFAEDGRNIHAAPCMKASLIKSRLDNREFINESEYVEFKKIITKIYDHTIYEPIIEKIISKSIIKMDINFKSMSLRADFYNQLTQLDGVVTTSSDSHNLEINSQYATKGHMAKKICALYGYHENEVVVIGDSINDISMLSMFPHSYAMGNANDEVKKHAKYIADTNANHGVAKVMYEIIESNKKEKK